MEFKIRLFTAVILWTGFNVVCCSIAGDICPNNGESWRVDKKDGNYRCILECSGGYVPSGCHVVRPLSNGAYNKPVPFCKEGPPIVSCSTVSQVGDGIARVVASHDLADKFPVSGAVVRLLSAWLQGPATVAVGWFIGIQSAGAACSAAMTQVGIGTYTASDYVMKTFKDCERE